MTPLIPPLHRIENNDAAYFLWRRADIRGGRLIHLDAHLDCEWVDAQAPALNVANFLCQTLREGCFSSVEWIVPDLSWKTRKNRSALIEHLQTVQSRYPSPHSPIVEEASALRLALLDVPVTVRPLCALAPCEELVVLDLDTDFLFIDQIPDTNTLAPRQTPWCTPTAVIHQLSACLRFKFITIAYSVEGGYLPLRWKFLGDELAARLSQPALPEITHVRWALQWQAAEALAQGKWRAASAAIKQAFAADEADPSASLLFAQAELCAAQEQTEKAQHFYAQAIAKDPSYATTANGLAWRYFQCGFIEQAEAEAGRMLSMNPADYCALFVLGRTAISLGREEEARGYLRKALALKPDFINAVEALGDLYLLQHRIPEAVAAYEQALGLGLGPALSLDDRFIATQPLSPTRIGPEHFALYRKLAPLYARLGRAQDSQMCERLWQAAELHGVNA